MQCPSCQHESPLEARFCQECGARLPAGDSTAHAPAAATLSDVDSAERRQLTIVFCDLVGSTPLAQQLDPEDMRDVLDAYHRCCADVIDRHGGHVAQLLGDGVLAYFGYPLAHEHAAQRAVHAGLDMVEAIGALPLALTSLRDPVQIRVGIHTGLVVVGELGKAGSSERLAIGGAPNVAARIQGVATPGNVVVSSSTCRLVKDYFVLEDLGPKELKGVSEPVEVYQVLEPTEVETRFDVAVKTGLIPLVGRSEELELLVERWKKVEAGAGQVVVLTGEPGIGKSRLTRALQERLLDRPHGEIAVRCSEYHQNTALYPLIDYLQRALAFQRDDTPAAKLEKLERAVDSYRLRTNETVPLFANLLSLPRPAGAPPLAMTPQTQKQRTLESLVDWALDTAQTEPVYLAVEDVHWADPSTQELLDLLVDRCTSVRALVIITSRTQALPAEWARHTHVDRIGLRRLAGDEIAQLISEIMGGRTLPALAVRQIAEKTDGVPLFMEELTKMVLESASAREADDADAEGETQDPLTIPATLQDSLMARLDRLPSARGVAQLAAALGREFSHELLQGVCPLDEPTLQESLATLVEAELLHREGEPPDVRYSFRHALVRDAAYGSLVKRKRQQFHQWIAQEIETEFPEIVETQPEIVARHFTEAGLVDRGLPHWQRAGLRAVAQSAFVEAVNHFTRALKLLDRLPASDEHSELELGLRSSLGFALIATRGYANEEVAQNYSRAEELSRALGDAPQLFPAVYGLFSYHMLRDHREPAFDLVARMDQLARRPEHRFVAEAVRGQVLYWSGEFVDAQARLQRAIELYDPGYHDLLEPSLGEDAALLPHLYQVWCLSDLGRYDQVRAALAEIKPLVAKRSSPYLEVTAVVFDMIVRLNMGEIDSSRELSEKVVALSTEQHFPFFLAVATCTRGSISVRTGSPEAGVAQMREGLAIFEATGTASSIAYWLARVGEGLLLEGKAAEGLATVAQALAGRETRLDRISVVDLLRLEGELRLLEPADAGEAERCFREALEVASAQGAVHQGILAAIGLGRLLGEQGRGAEARDILSAWHGRFTEGFDVSRVVEARELLAELS